MRVIAQLLLAAAGFCAVASAQAGVITVTGDSPSGWTASVRAASTGAINGSNPYLGNGSVQMSLGDGSGKADFVNYWGIVDGRTLGNLNALGFDWYRNSGGSAPAHLAPALRLAYDLDGNSATTNDRGYLIWESVYNGGGSVLLDQWVSSDILEDNFWQRKLSPGVTVEQYGNTLEDWMNSPLASPAVRLGINAAIIGIEVGIGSGWNGSFDGFVDNVRFGFKGEDVTAYNFETASQPPADVPEPGSIALLGLGLLGLALGRRNQR